MIHNLYAEHRCYLCGRLIAVGYVFHSAQLPGRELHRECRDSIEMTCEQASRTRHPSRRR